MPKDLEKIIPRSTRHSWRKQCTIEINENALSAFEKESLDYAELFIEKEKAISLSVSLGEIIKVYQKIFINEEVIKKQLLSKNKTQLLEIIDNLKDEMGLKKYAPIYPSAHINTMPGKII